MRLCLFLLFLFVASSQSKAFYLSDTVANYGLQYVGSTKDTTFLFINPPSSQKPYVIEQIGMSLGTDFSVINVSRKLPYKANPGDTVYYTVRYTVQDTTTHFDTIYVKTDCDYRQKIVRGEGGCGILVASDHDFGRAAVSDYSDYYDISVDTISIINIGKLPVQISHNINFTIDSVFQFRSVYFGNRAQLLPCTLLPKQKVRMGLVYYPIHDGIDTATLYLTSDIHTEFRSYGKPYIKLKGTGLLSGVEWNIDTLVFTSAGDTTIDRVFLRTTHSLATEVEEVFIDGPDMDEFFIYKTQRPIKGGVVIDTADSIWIDIGFKPDISKPSWYVRSAYVRTYDKANYEEIDTIILRGNIGSLGLPDVNITGIPIYPNPARDYVLVNGDYKDIKLFDGIGREVKLQIDYFNNPIRIELNGLPSGVYNLQHKDADGQVSIEKLIIQ